MNCWKCKHLQLVGSREGNIPIHVYFCDDMDDYLDDEFDKEFMNIGCWRDRE